MDKVFEKNTFGKRLTSMLHVDFRRMITTPLIYIILGICLVAPVLIFVMTTMMDGMETVNPETNEVEITESKFDNFWQIIGTVSDPSKIPSSDDSSDTSSDTTDTSTDIDKEGKQNPMGDMDITSMVNINMLYFAVAIYVCLFVGADFRSGYSKNLFTVRSSKVDYVISKILVGMVAGVLMLIAFFIGSVIGGAIMQIPFDPIEIGASAYSVAFCLLSKVCLVGVFVPIYVLASVITKQRVWLAIILSVGIGMLLFTMIPMITPLDSSFINPVLCLVGSLLFSVGLGAVSNIVLKNTSLV
ncbi:MAG: ABC transporter permease [Clostridia bacterium]|nr:ABC transporter permease [Clostridia bacterium]